jgi:hypothetical protein
MGNQAKIYLKIRRLWTATPFITMVTVAQAAGRAIKSDHHVGFVPLFDNSG